MFPTGRRTFVVQYRTPDGRSRRDTIGDVRVINLEEARDNSVAALCGDTILVNGNELVQALEQNKKKVICFVTGAPGASKALLGLEIALKSKASERTAALLSGNRPLVHVFTSALAEDHVVRTSISKADAKYRADAVIQSLLGYLKEHTDGAAPPEHVIVFGEAQRAWDEKVGQELVGRPKSEPDLFLEFLGRPQTSIRVGWLMTNDHLSTYFEQKNCNGSANLSISAPA